MSALLAAIACRMAPEAPLPQSSPIVVKPARRDERWKNARCNDGTPWSYVVRRTDSPIWVIELAGGYFCDEAFLMCRDRKRVMTTTRAERDGAISSLRAEGLFSTDETINPMFARANHVAAHYCSSDLWLGDSIQQQPNSAAEEGWFFTGKENVRVLTEALRDLEHLDDADPQTQILVVGASSGGAGLVGNLATFKSAFPHAAAQRRLKIVIDGAWVPPPPDDTHTPDVVRWGSLDAACEERARAEGRDARTCLYGPAWWPTVRDSGIPTLIAVSGLDVTQTPAFGIETPQAMDDWRRRVRRSLSESDVPWVFSSAMPYHTVAFEPIFSKGPQGSTFREVLDRFFRDAPAERVFLRYPETP